jgi:hypothetical protein
LSISLDSAQYGAFINPAGQRVPSPLNGVLYSDARAGKVKFVADGLKPASLPLPASKLRASSTELQGADTVCFNARVLHLTTGRRVFRPLLNAHNIIDPTDPEPDVKKKRRLLDLRRVDTTRVVARLTDLLGRPMGGDSLIMLASVRPMSGGHDHDTLRPLGRFMIAVGETVAVARVRTDLNGSASIVYRSSGIGGIDSIRVRSKNGRDSSAIALDLRIANLQLLGAGSHYELIGAYGQGAVTSRHTVNHFGTSDLLQKLQALADTVYADSGKSIRINDMSLEYGGPFDTKNLWHPPHRTHREGRDVDVDDKFSDDRTISQKYLKRVLEGSPFNRRWGQTLFWEGDHYHLAF